MAARSWPLASLQGWRLAVALVIGVLLAGLGIVDRAGLLRREISTDSDTYEAFQRLLRCGDWSTSGMLDPTPSSGGWTCANYTRRIELKPEQRHSGVLPDSCKEWCSEGHPPELGGGWCCSWKPSRDGGECAWTNGRAVRTDNRCATDSRRDARLCVQEKAMEACPFSKLDGMCKLGRGVIAQVMASTASKCYSACIARRDCVAFAFSDMMAARDELSCEIYGARAARRTARNAPGRQAHREPRVQHV